MRRHLGNVNASIVTIVILSAISYASVINDEELNILASVLSDSECQKLLSVLYGRRQSRPTRSRLQRARDVTGRCALDLERWLDSEATVGGRRGLPLAELSEALRAVGKPALAQQIEKEVFAEKTHNLQNFFGRDGRLASKDIFRKRYH